MRQGLGAGAQEAQARRVGRAWGRGNGETTYHALTRWFRRYLALCDREEGQATGDDGRLFKATVVPVACPLRLYSCPSEGAAGMKVW